MTPVHSIYGVVGENSIAKDFAEWAKNETKESVKATRITCRHAEFESDEDLPREEFDARLDKLYNAVPFVGKETQLSLRARRYDYGIRVSVLGYKMFHADSSDMRLSVLIRNGEDVKEMMHFIFDCIIHDPRTFR